MKASRFSVATLSFSALLLLSTACQEKVAPELTDAGVSGTVTSGGGGGVAVPHSFTLSLGPTPTNDVPPATLNYQLHLANDVAGTKCEVADIIDTPDTIPSIRDITCMVEAEEFALYDNGLQFDVKTDAETCDYVAYKPYYFQGFRPGLTARLDGSARRMLNVTCTAEAIAAAGGPGFVPNAAQLGGYTNTDGLTLGQLCNRAFNVTTVGMTNSITGSASALVGQDAPQMFCSFDYTRISTTNPGPNCDEGKIDWYTTSFTAQDTNGDTIPDLVSNTTYLDHSCDGNVRECARGPMVEELGDAWLTEGKVARDTYTKGEATTISYKVASPRQTGFKTNKYIANFTRQCSGVSLWNTPSAFASSANSYNPNIIASYVESTLQSNGSQELDANNFDIILLGDDPFRSLIQTEPHYQFLCLDKAFDIKARIRVVVREWNKNFNPLTQSFAFVSDLHLNIAPAWAARMDATMQQTIPYAPWVNYNDIRDWDDDLRWDDSFGASCDLSRMSNGVTPFNSAAWYPGANL